MTDIRALLDLTAEASRRNLLSLEGKEFWAELNRRQNLITKMLDESVIYAKKRAIQIEEEYEAEMFMRYLGLEARDV